MEVLQEEELKEMKKQQENFKQMMENDNAEIRKMEEQERKRLETHEAKKGMEKGRRNNRKNAHEKLVCRTIAKKFLRDVKPNSFVLLKDLSFFRDDFREVTMYQDVLPWMFAQAETFVKHIESLEKYPTTMIARHIDDTCVNHMDKVNLHIQHIESIRQAKVQAEEDKAAAKLRRQQDRAAKKKQEQINALKAQIETTFVKKLVPVEAILMNDLVEIDGWQNCANRELKPSVTVLGGYLGQIMIILNAVANEFGYLDKGKEKGVRGSQ